MESRSTRSPSEGRLGGVRVLIVDYTPGVLDVVAEILQRHGATVIPVTSAEEALTALRAADKGYFVAAVTAAGEAGADYAAFVARLKTLTPAKGKALFQPLRAALTGRLDGPELASLFALLGADRIRRRLEKPPC